MNEFIEKLKEKLSRNNIFRTITNSECKNVFEIIDELAEEYKLFGNSEQVNGGWIPCSERLPEEYMEVLGYSREGHTYLVKMYDTKIYGKVWRQWNGGELKLDWIIAWQPLPEPYQQKEGAE